MLECHTTLTLVMYMVPRLPWSHDSHMINNFSDKCNTYLVTAEIPHTSKLQKIETNTKQKLNHTAKKIASSTHFCVKLFFW